MSIFLRRCNQTINFKLTHLSICYLIIPYFIFFVFWLKPYIGIICLLTGLISCYYCIKATDKRKETDSHKISLKKFFFILVFSLIIVFISRIGSYSNQRGDYYKHNFIFKDLTTFEWPVIYQENKNHAEFLCYNLAYYIPPAFCAKKISPFSNKIASIKIFSTIWGFFGFFLVFSWVFIICKSNSYLTLIIFVILIGFDSIVAIFYSIIECNIEPMFNFQGLTILVNHVNALHHPNNMKHIIWAPQHCIGGWIIMAWLYNDIKQKENDNFFFIHSLSIFWSLFVFIGLIPFTIYLLFKRFDKRILTFQNIIGAGSFAILFFLYYNAHLPLKYFDFILNLPFSYDKIRNYLFFVFYEFLLYGIFMMIFRHKISILKKEKDLIILSLVFLSILSLFIIGRYNDLVMRSSIPASFLLSCYVIHIINNRMLLKRNFDYYFFLGVILLGSWIPINDAIYSFLPNNRIQYIELDPNYVFYINGDYNLSLLDEYYNEVTQFDLDFDTSIQYMGRENSFFYKYIIKK